jgi:hypothetical protein
MSKKDSASAAQNAQAANQFLDLAAKFYNVVLSLGLLALAYYLKWNVIVLVLFAISLLLFVPPIKRAVDNVVSEAVKKVIAAFMAMVAAVSGFFGIGNQEPVQPPTQNNKALSSQVFSGQSSIKAPTAAQNRASSSANGGFLGNIFGGNNNSSNNNQNNKDQNNKDNQPRPKGYIEGTCEDLKAKGVGVVRRGEPNYSEERDRDGDGVACEGNAN